ncbi:MAG: MerR family transcriptional regulator [Dehalococcoidia bacterium]|nr:MerR family transcriptional regulator [Dehalococcoidia bacterium]
MSLLLNRKRYYRTAEACKRAGISRSTFFRWLRKGLFQDVETFDRRGWRLFTEKDLRRLKKEANRISLNSSG